MPYQSTPEDRTRAYIIGAIYVVLALGLGLMLFKIWPPIPWPSDSPKDKERLAAIIKEAACSEAATATPSPQASPTVNAGPTASPSPTPTATQSATPSTSGTRPAVQPTARPASTQAPTPAGAATPAGTPSPAMTPLVNAQTGELEAIPMKLFGQCIQTTFDERLLLLVIIVGMLGAFVHGATSLADYLGNNAFNKSWTWFYLLRPAIGMALALVFYFAIRGGFLSTTGGAKDINPYGIAALAGMVGMFSKQATDKLGEIFSTLFRSAGDDRRDDPLNGTTVALKVEPGPVVAGGESVTLTVTGGGFVNGSVINLDDKPQPTTFLSATQLSAQVAKETITNAGTLKLTVVNPDQTKPGPVDFVVSVAGAAAGTPAQPASGAGAAAATTEKPVSGEGGDADFVDGCDVEMKADTPDEDLPITEGGVK